MATPEENWGCSEEQLYEIRTYAKFNNRIRRFRNNSTLSTFQEIFGESEGERLRRHYSEVNHDFEKFMTYLTLNQRNDLFAYIVKNYNSDR